jgi:hypothetical protein
MHLHLGTEEPINVCDRSRVSVQFAYVVYHKRAEVILLQDRKQIGMRNIVEGLLKIDRQKAYGCSV